jgi:cardiolipin synthase
MKLSSIPNVITVIRILLVAPTSWMLWNMDYAAALVLMALAGLSDALDGALARRFNWGSKLGAALDPIADKILVVVMFVVFTIQGHFPLWLAIVVIGRDVTIFTGAGVYRYLFKEIDFEPTMISKANTALQIMTLLVLLLALCDFGILSERAMNTVDPWMFGSLAVLCVLSGLDYVITWSRKALNHPSRTA